ncbi:MAG: GTP cyclohydrolase II [Candidatus Puniceispirillaceae bacterium]
MKQSQSPSYRRMSQAFSALRRGETILIRAGNNRAALLRAAEFADYEDGQMAEIADSATILCLRRQHVESLNRKAPGTRPVFTMPVNDLSTHMILDIALGQTDKLPDTVSVLGEQKDSLADLGTKILRQARLLPTALLATLNSDDPQHHNRLATMYALPIVNAFDSDHHESASYWQMTKGAAASLPLAAAPDAQIIMFRSEGGDENHFAIIIGKADETQNPYVRLHSQCVTGDVLGSLKCDCGPQLQTALSEMSKQGGGILLYLAQEGRDIGLMNKIRAYGLQDSGHDTVDANHKLGFATDERIFIPAAAMLQQLGVRSVRLMTNNPDKVSQLQQYGINVTERVPLILASNPHNEAYMATKRDRTGHLLDE